MKSKDICEETNAEKNSTDKEEILKLLLKYLVPKEEVENVSKVLLKKFGSLTSIYSASIDELSSIKGISENIAVFFRVQSSIFNKMFQDSTSDLNKDMTVKNLNLVEQLIRSRFFGLNDENFLLLLADAKHKIKFCEIILKGDPQGVRVDVKKIINLALTNKAKYAIIAHNHPSGVPVPSEGDNFATIQIRDALKAIEVELLDHYILSEMTCVSLAKLRLMP